MPALARSVQIGAGGSVARGLAPVVQAKELGANAMVIAPDGKTLVAAGSSGIVWIDTGGLHAGTRLLNDWTVTSLALSPDGKVLWALNDAGKVAEIQMASRQVAATFDAEAYPIALMRVEAA